MRSPTQHHLAITVLFTFAILFSAVISTPVLIGAQVENAANVPSSDKIGVKIMSPSGNVTVPSGPLTIYGISSDTSKTNCRVYVDWNDLKPMQNVTGKGLSGGNDYSNWTYTYTEKYHTIAPGINELTSKITCFDNPNNITSKYYSINITGLKNNTVSPTLPSSNSNISSGYHSLGYLPQYNGFYHDIFQPIIRDESPGQDSSNNNSPDDNDDEAKDDNNNDNNEDSDGTNNDNTKNDDSQSQNNSHSDDVKNDRSSSSSEANDDENEHSNTRSHSGDDENKKQQDNHEKKHNDNNHKKNKGSEKHEGAHSKNLKAHKQRH
jgi:hypothetical protein